MNRVGSVYGEALYSLAGEENLSELILQELNVLEEAFSQESDFLKLLSAPNLPVAERCQMVDNCFRGKIQPYLLNFLKILTQKGLSRQFSDCCRCYRQLYNQDHNILPVTAVTAVPLTQEQSAKLAAKLSEITGKTAQLHNRVDPECLGGVRLDYDGKRVDGSVANRLEAVRKLLKNTVL